MTLMDAVLFAPIAALISLGPGPNNFCALNNGINYGFRAALLATYEAVPEPRVVIASGSCPISGGPFHGSAEIVGPLDSLLPVDLYIPGCPPHPMTTLHALLAFFKR